MQQQRTCFLFGHSLLELRRSCPVLACASNRTSPPAILTLNSISSCHLQFHCIFMREKYLFNYFCKKCKHEQQTKKGYLFLSLLHSCAFLEFYVVRLPNSTWLCLMVAQCPTAEMYHVYKQSPVELISYFYFYDIVKEQQMNILYKSFYQDKILEMEFLIKIYFYF